MVVKDKKRQSSIRSKKLRVILALSGGGAIGLFFLSGLCPRLTEAVYSRTVFPALRFCLDYTVCLLPFPLLYILLISLAGMIFRMIFRRIKRGKSTRIPLRKRLAAFLLNFAACLGIIIFLFYFLWGFNYRRMPLAERLEINLRPLDSEQIRIEAVLAVQNAAASRQKIQGIQGLKNLAMGKRLLPDDLENRVRKNLTEVLQNLGYPSSGRVRVKKLWSADFLMRLGASGFYFPLTGEGYISSNLTAAPIPFLMAHEMAHGYGFAREGEVNFLAYLACLNSRDPFISYSGYFVYLNYILNELYMVNPLEYKRLVKEIPRGIQADRLKRYNNWKKYRGWLSDLGQKVYHSYLKTQGIGEGIKSYNRLLVMVYAWKSRISEILNALTA